MAGVLVARGLLVCALVLLVTLCAGSAPAEEEAAAAKAESCETGTGAKEPLSAWVVLQWTVVMALARCVSFLPHRQASPAAPAAPAAALPLQHPVHRPPSAVGLARCRSS